MRPLIWTALIALSFGCTEDSDSKPAPEEHEHEHGHDAALDLGSEDSGHHHAGDADHPHEDMGHHHADDAGHTTPDSGGVDPSLEAYCVCMLFNCHDPFHARWGESDEDANAACLAAVALLPRAESSASTGNSLECRLNACAAAEESMDPATCPAALGDETCTDE